MPQSNTDAPASTRTNIASLVFERAARTAPITENTTSGVNTNRPRLGLKSSPASAPATSAGL